MKISLNLSPRSSARDRYALGWGIPALLLGAAALVLLWRASLREYREYRESEAQLAQIQGRVDGLARQESEIRAKLEDPASRDLRTRARFLNELIAERQLSLAQVSSRLAGLLPDDAHLTALAFASPKEHGGDYGVRIGITAKGEDAIETYINDLEDSPDFKDVSIINQGFQEDPAQGSQINLVCTARYLPGAQVESEAGSKASEGGDEKSAAGKPENALKDKKPEVTKQNRPGNPPARVVGPPKTETKSAQKPTPNRKPNR
jgi:hypothetical protein